jgi:hypothetical protein
MREPKTFILTILLDEQDAEALHGRLRSVATGAEGTFSGVSELVARLRAELGAASGAETPRAAGPDASDSGGDSKGDRQQ